MFELPEAKRVRREDLRGSDGSDWCNEGDEVIDAGLYARLNAQIARSLGLDASQAETLSRPAQESRPRHEKPDAEPTDNGHGATETSSGNNGNEDEDLGEFEFRLFSSATAAPKVVLENDKEAHGEGRFVGKRPPSYFLATDIPSDLKRQYQYAAVSGEEVLDRSRWRRWGLELPWKVSSVTQIKRKARPGDEGRESGRIDEAPNLTKRKRPGKKTRITLRTKARAKKAEEDTVTKKQTDKEEHLKDKKKRMNRLKKLRKRAKDKEKKTAVRGDSEAAGSDGDSDDLE